MATILFSAAGAAVGGSIGGTLAGLSSVAVGRAVGATLGRVVDQKILGSGGQAVESGKVDRFRLTSAGEGDPITQLYGRLRIGGQVIWASDFEEVTTTSGGGKGGGSKPETTEYSYSVNVAIALCEGEITRVGRIWADGEEVSRDDLSITVYTGSADQQPDPLMEAIEGPGMVPAYRGTAYVVMEALALQQFGNRVPQFSFEVIRPEQRGAEAATHALSYGIEGVALIPGTGEYALATTPVSYEGEGKARWSANINSPSGKTDFVTSLETLDEELPELKAASLVVSWFGSDLRMGQCRVQPKVEDSEIDGEEMPWGVAGISRDAAEVIAGGADGRPVYGGTPADAAVIEAIQAMNAAGKAVMLYPFILMDQLEGNTLPNPYTGEEGQPALPWRGRITLDRAPGVEGSAEGTAAVDDEVVAFFGTTQASDFTVADGVVSYSGPDEWTLSRFILHYAALCKAAGGVDAFCIGSEMRGLTQVRSGRNVFPAVQAFIALAAQVRTIVGAETKVSYAADWSEYFGYQPQDGTGDRLFHLDPSGLIHRSISLALITTCPCQIGVRGWRIKMRLSGMTSTICATFNPISRVVRGLTGFMVRQKSERHKSGHRSPTAPMMSLGSTGIKTSAIGGVICTMTVSMGSVVMIRPRGCLGTNLSGSRNTVVRLSTMARTSRTNFWTSNHRRVVCRAIPTGAAMI